MTDWRDVIVNPSYILTILLLQEWCTDPEYLLLLTCSSQDFGFFYLQLWSPFLPQSALQGEMPEGLAQLILLLLLFLCYITALAEQAGCQGNVSFFPGKFYSSQAKLH